MTFTAYKLKNLQEKFYNEGVSAAKAAMRETEISKQYCGNELIAKYQKHNGDFVYLMSEEVVKEVLKYIAIMNEAAETTYNWDCLGRCPSEITKKEKALMYFVDGLKPDRKIFESIKNCYKGSPMMSFYRDEEALKLQREQEEKRKAVQDMWGY